MGDRFPPEYAFKPNAKALEALWIKALRHGLARDFNTEAVDVFDKIDRQFIYYGDLSNRLLARRDPDYDERADLKARRKALKRLKKHAKGDFKKAKYHEISSQFRWLPELLADVVAGPAAVFGFGDNVVAAKAPDMRRYWNEETRFGSDVRWKLTEPLRDAFRNKDDIMLIGHSLGTVVAYDVLWKFSYLGEYQRIREHRLSHLVTLGSPLGNPIVQKRLKGGGLAGSRRYPTNVAIWSNVAAEDDYVCHDETIEDEYGSMRDTKTTDYPIYNLAVKSGKAHQHHATGYLIHPVVIRLVHEWIGT